MKKASQYFDDEQRRQIAHAVASAESKTSAEIVPCVATASGRYDRAEDVVGLWLAIVGFAAVYLLAKPVPQELGSWVESGEWFLLPAMVLAALLGFMIGAIAASRIGWLRRLFTPVRQMHEDVSQRARAAFFDNRICHTTGAAGILLYVSLYERMAVVLADQAIADKLGPNALQDVCAALTTRLKDCHPADALCEAIAAAGEKVATALPRAANDTNELPNALVTLDG